MKEKLLKIIYLTCCLLVAFTPNRLNNEINEVNEVMENTEISTASKSEIDKYAGAFEKLEITRYEELTSIIIMKDGLIYFEKYYNGNDKNSIYDIGSCTNTIIALLTGIAIDYGIVGDEKSNFLDLFQTIDVAKISPGIANITLENMLTMNSGINWNKFSNSFKNKTLVIKNELNYGLCLIPSVEIEYPPGTYFKHDSNESRSLMAMLAYNAGMEDIKFADKYLFDKLEIENFLWPFNDSGVLPGGKDFMLSSRDLAKVGQLLLDGGMYKEEQVVSKEWIDKMLVPVLHNVLCEDIAPKDEINYGYYIWHTKYKGVDINFAYGSGGQYLFLVPKYNICIVTSAIDKGNTENYRNIAYAAIDIFQREELKYE